MLGKYAWRVDTDGLVWSYLTYLEWKRQTSDRHRQHGSDVKRQCIRVLECQRLHLRDDQTSTMTWEEDDFFSGNKQVHFSDQYREKKSYLFFIHVSSDFVSSYVVRISIGMRVGSLFSYLFRINSFGSPKEEFNIYEYQCSIKFSWRHGLFLFRKVLVLRLGFPVY